MKIGQILDPRNFGTYYLKTDFECCWALVCEPKFRTKHLRDAKKNLEFAILKEGNNPTVKRTQQYYEACVNALLDDSLKEEFKSYNRYENWNEFKIEDLIKRDTEQRAERTAEDNKKKAEVIHILIEEGYTSQEIAKILNCPETFVNEVAGDIAGKP